VAAAVFFFYTVNFCGQVATLFTDGATQSSKSVAALVMHLRPFQFNIFFAVFTAVHGGILHVVYSSSARTKGIISLQEI
jgi:hypothetical protein